LDTFKEIGDLGREDDGFFGRKNMLSKK